MLILPAFMTLLFLTFPAGLVLYWLTNNVLTIGQQVITDRYIFKTKTPFLGSAAPAAPEGSTDARSSKKAREKASSTADEPPAS